MSWDANLPPLLREHLREKFHEAEMWLALRDVLEARNTVKPAPRLSLTSPQWDVFRYERPNPMWDIPTPM